MSARRRHQKRHAISSDWAPGVKERYYGDPLRLREMARELAEEEGRKDGEPQAEAAKAPEGGLPDV